MLVWLFFTLGLTKKPFGTDVVFFLGLSKSKLRPCVSPVLPGRRFFWPLTCLRTQTKTYDCWGGVVMNGFILEQKKIPRAAQEQQMWTSTAPQLQMCWFCFRSDTFFCCFFGTDAISCSGLAHFWKRKWYSFQNKQTSFASGRFQEDHVIMGLV